LDDGFPSGSGHSKSDREQVLYLDHPRDGSKWKLTDTPKPHETTENHWRFRFPLPPSVTTKFAVQQDQTLWQSFTLADVTEEQLAGWLGASYLDKKAEKALRDVLAARQTAGQIDAPLAALEKERTAITADQKWLRDNLGSLGDRATEKELRERFVRTLGQQEDRLEALTAESKKLHADRDAARDRVLGLLAKLDYDGTPG
jgi:hypothetical protein